VEVGTLGYASSVTGPRIRSQLISRIGTDPAVSGRREPVKAELGGVRCREFSEIPR
jgi:hypothetical protein